jgi:hypothetical protein
MDNWIDSPGYKLAKHLNTILNNVLQLPNAFNLQNTSTLAHSLKMLKINENTRLCSFDVEDMYTNIPIHEVQNIVRNIINENYNISQPIKREIKNLLNTILEQNYIEHNGKWYK